MRLNSTVGKKILNFLQKRTIGWWYQRFIHSNWAYESIFFTQEIAIMWNPMSPASTLLKMFLFVLQSNFMSLCEFMKEEDWLWLSKKFHWNHHAAVVIGLEDQYRRDSRLERLNHYYSVIIETWSSWTFSVFLLFREESQFRGNPIGFE